MAKERSWFRNWEPSKQRYREKRGPVFAENLATFDPPLPVCKIAAPAHLDYTVELAQSYFPAPGVEGLDAPMAPVRSPIPGVDPEPRALPIHGTWTPRQPAEVLEALRDFLPVAAAGPLVGMVKGDVAARGEAVQGARFAVVFDAGQRPFLSSRLQHYVLLKEPTCLTDESMLIRYTPYWPSERATLSMDAVTGMVTPAITIRRGRSVHWRSELSDALSYFRTLARDGFQDMALALERMARRPIEPDAAFRRLGEIYRPLPMPPGIRAKIAKGLELRGDDRRSYDKLTTQNRYPGDHYPAVAMTIFERIGANHPEMAGTHLALYLAVCALEDSRWPRVGAQNNLTYEALFSTQTNSRHQTKLRAFKALAEG